MTTSRISTLDLKALSPAQRKVYDAVVAGPRGEVAGPLRVWLQSPELAARAQSLGEFARFGSSLEPKLSELAILVTARFWGSDFEWATHAPIAKAAGIDPEVIEQIAHGKRPEFDDDVLASVFDFAVELHRDHAVSQASFERAETHIGKTGVVDLVGICGYYTLISMTINVFHIPADNSEGLPSLDTPPHLLFE